MSEQLTSDDLLDWLLDSDPAIRWKVLRDLTGATPSEVGAERARVAEVGWGAQVLAQQKPDGQWGDGDYSPKWTSTTYTLLLLHWLGLPPGHPQAHRGLDRLWRAWGPRLAGMDTCLVAMLAILSCSHAYPTPRLDDPVQVLLDSQQEDGGWNCDARGDRARHSSFHTSIQALEGLALYRTHGGRLDVTSAEAAGREFFLRHHLYQSHRTGEPAIRGSLRFPQLPQWHFDVLRGLEHFTTVGADRDPRLADAVAVVRAARRADGRWSTYAAYPARHRLVLEPRGPSRWNTARVLRVLQWWEGGGSGPAPGAGTDRVRERHTITG